MIYEQTRTFLLATFIVALAWTTAYVARMYGWYTTAWARVRGEVRSARKALPDLVGRVIRDGVTYSLFSDGTQLPVLAGGAPFEVAIETDSDIAALSAPDVRKAVAERSELLSQIFQEAGDVLDASKVTVVDVKDGQDLADQISRRNDELTKLGERVTKLDELDAIKAENTRRVEHGKGHDKDPKSFAPAPSADDRQAPPVKTIGDLFVGEEGDGQALAAARAKQQASYLHEDFDAVDWLKNGPRNADFTTSAGWAPESIRTGRVVLSAEREPEIIDLFPVFPTTQAAVVYMEETTFTNATAERAEAAAYAESALVLTEKSETVRSLGNSIPVTDEQVADVEGVRAYLDGRLDFMVRQRIDSQSINGNGTAPNVRGTLNVSGINNQAKGSDPIPDAIHKAMRLVRVTGRALPSGVIMNPTDWEKVRLLRTADGVYIWGSPSQGGPARIWGLPVVQSDALAAGTGIVGDYARHSALHPRSGIEIATGFVNDDFLKGLTTVRAGIRLAIIHYRPTAFTKVTGL